MTAVAVAERPAPARAPVPPAGSVRRRPVVRPWLPDFAGLLVGLGLGASLALPFTRITAKALAAPGGLATFAGDLTAMAGTYLLLVMVLLAARLPGVEAVVGQDRLIRWHRRLSPAPLLLLGAHGVLTTMGFAQAVGVGPVSEAGTLIATMSWILAAVVAYLMMVGIAGVSIRAVRRRMNYDTWWVIHLYTYLALAFSVPHQIFSGNDFIGHPLAKAAWVLLWLGTAGTVVAFRILLPVVRSAWHRLEIVHVRPEAPGVFSLVVRGRHLERLPVAGGQYLAWRFLTRDLWWHAHPYSLSAMPSPPFLRVTIKAEGDTSRRIASLRPGTRIAIEGPYGAFTDQARTRPKVALVGAGVGVTPLVALLEDMSPEVDVVVAHRASSEGDLVHRKELAQLVKARGGRLFEMAGRRRAYPLHDPRYLAQVIPDLAERDLFVCGPDGFSAGVVGAARTLGLEESAIHFESFEF